MLTPTLSLVAAYLLGAIPFGLLVARARGIDIRSVGSGNIGATNVFRTVGKSWGILTLFMDALKGFIPAYTFPMLAETLSGTPTADWLPLACGCAAVVGHNWPVYIGFKGGKGIATTAGALLGFAPAPLGIGMLAFAVALGASRYVSLGSILAAIVIPASAWLMKGETSALTPAVLTALGAVAVIKHRANIRRLLNGTENRINFGKKS